MALLEIKSPVAAAIEGYYHGRQTPEDWPYIRCSSIGKDCWREIWYDLRWVTTLKRHDGRLDRLFETGHLAEERFVADLRAIGCDVLDKDPETEKQWTVSFLDGHFRGSCDAKVWRVPMRDPEQCHLGEFKTMNEKAYNEWRKHGVQWAKPTYYSQVQIYLYGLGLEAALFMAVNKNTDQVETEIVPFDPDHADYLLNKAAQILNADEAPEKAESFNCRWCKHKPVCLDGAWPRVNCRTCIDFRFKTDGGWFCDLHQCELSLDAQKKPCDKHLSIPSLVPNAQIVTADEDERTVTYQFADGTVFVDGRDEKPAAAESE